MKGAVFRLILQISRGILRDRRTRRSVMFIVVLAALVMLFCGAVFLDAFLMRRPLLFSLYWLACAGLTIFAILMAIYDLLMVRRDALHQRRQLRRKIFGRKDEP